MEIEKYKNFGNRKIIAEKGGKLLLSRYRERGGDKIFAKRKDIQIKNKRRYSL